MAAMNACTAARTRSQLSMIVRRESRSATTPPASVKTTRAIVNEASTPPSAVAELWIDSTANVRATGTIASPIAEATRPSQSSLKPLRRNGRAASPRLLTDC
jgi:hypothetical protein